MKSAGPISYIHHRHVKKTLHMTPLQQCLHWDLICFVSMRPDCCVIVMLNYYHLKCVKIEHLASVYILIEWKFKAKTRLKLLCAKCWPLILLQLWFEPHSDICVWSCICIIRMKVGYETGCTYFFSCSLLWWDIFTETPYGCCACCVSVLGFSSVRLYYACSCDQTLVDDPASLHVIINAHFVRSHVV